MTEKSILEQALLQVQNLEEAVKANAKGILASTMKRELSELLKESEEEEELPTDDEEDVPDETGDEMSQETLEDDEEMDSTDTSDDEEEVDSPDDEDMDTSDDEDMDSMDTSDDNVMDMTKASHDEVLKVFKAMKPEDGIIVKKEDDELDLEIDGDEYIIKLDDEDSQEDLNETMDDETMDDETMDDETMVDDQEDDLYGDDSLGNDDSGLDEENVYEIELDDESMSEMYDDEMSEMYDDEMSEMDDEEMAPLPPEEMQEYELDDKKIEATEAARTKSNPHGNKAGLNRSGLPSKKKYKAGSGVFGINEEVNNLRRQNKEYKKALVLFKEKLNEVAVFNANLAYATRLFTEHSTTKQEKLNILKRFDSVSTMNESKNLFNTLKSELETKKPVTESVVNKIASTPSTSSSNVLSESKAYENPQFKRMKDLMSKIK